MNKKVIILSAITAVIAGVAVVYAQGSITQPTHADNLYQPAPSAISIPAVSKAVHPLDRGDVKVADLNEKAGPNKELVILDNDYIGQVKKMNATGEYMNKFTLVLNLHAMTHQKVRADQFGLSIKMTPEFIDVMIENINNTNGLSDQLRADFLLIVESWKTGDFSTIVKDHNYFWTLQGGTIGKAIEANTSEEESQFVKLHFAQKDTSLDPNHDTALPSL
jgi:hypothetical protein